MAVLGFGEYAGRAAGAIVGIPVGMWVVKIVIGTEYSDFRIALLPIADKESPVT